MMMMMMMVVVVVMMVVVVMVMVVMVMVMVMVVVVVMVMATTGRRIVLFIPRTFPLMQPEVIRAINAKGAHLKRNPR